MSGTDKLKQDDKTTKVIKMSSTNLDRNEKGKQIHFGDESHTKRKVSEK